MANKLVAKTADWLLVIGGLNWGLTLFDVNLVTMLLGAWPIAVTLVYALVGLSAIRAGAQMLGLMKGKR